MDHVGCLKLLFYTRRIHFCCTVAVLHLLDIVLGVKLGRQLSVYWFTLQLPQHWEDLRGSASDVCEPEDKEPRTQKHEYRNGHANTDTCFRTTR